MGIVEYKVIVERRLSSDESLGLGKYGVTVTRAGVANGNPRNLSTPAGVSKLLLDIGVPQEDAKALPEEADKQRRIYPFGPSAKGAVTRSYDLDPATVAIQGF